MATLSIGIVGAGIAGLVAGIELRKSGYDITVFESRTRSGGRIWSLNMNGFVIESGPEFIHGRLKETLGLLKKYNISYDEIDGKMYRSANGRFDEPHELTEGWDFLIDKMKSLESDLSFQDFLDQHFPGTRFSSLRKSAIRYAEGFDLADVRLASTQALVLEWENEESEQYRIPSGYATLTRALENDLLSMGGKILLNHAVESVSREAAGIHIYVSQNRHFRVDKLLVTVPLSCLNQAAPESETILFDSLPDEKRKAFGHIGFGTVIKIILIWKTSFWKTIIPDAQFIVSDTFIPTWWTQHPMDVPILTGWFGGPKADLSNARSDAFFLDKAMESLSVIFSLPVEELRSNLMGSRVFNWKNEPWSRGAYSYGRAGYKNARTLIGEPVDQLIYFAGEACYEGPYPGTVEAAVVSGLEISKRILTGSEA
jgi:monoamine oxidase